MNDLKPHQAQFAGALIRMLRIEHDNGTVTSMEPISLNDVRKRYNEKHKEAPVTLSDVLICVDWLKDEGQPIGGNCVEGYWWKVQ